MFTIVIPVYNEEKSIKNTISKCNAIIRENGDSNSEIIVVDDCSNDTTYEILKNIEIKLIRHLDNMGYGRSLKDGIMASQNDVIIITDGDETYPIEEIPNLFAEFKNGYNMVVGARKGKYFEESLAKQILRWILKFLVEFTAGKNIEDINSGLRIFRKSEILPYFTTLCDTFSFTTSLTLAYIMTGKYVKYIPIKYNKRKGKTKVKMVKDSMRTIQFIIEAILYYNPIKIFIVFSFLLVILGMLNLVIAFFSYLTIAYIIGISCILLAIIMFGLGLLSIQLNQILTNTRNNDKTIY